VASLNRNSQQTRNTQRHFCYQCAAATGCQCVRCVNHTSLPPPLRAPRAKAGLPPPCSSACTGTWWTGAYSTLPQVTVHDDTEKKVTLCSGGRWWWNLAGSRAPPLITSQATAPSTFTGPACHRVLLLLGSYSGCWRAQTPSGSLNCFLQDASLPPLPVPGFPAPNAGPNNSTSRCTAKIDGGYSVPCTSVNSGCKTMQAADVASINSTTQKWFGLVHSSLMCSQQSPCGQSPEAS